MARVLLAEISRASSEIGATRSRLRKAAVIADLLRSASPAEVGLVVGYLSGELAQRRTGLGPASLRDLPPPADVATLGVEEVDAAMETISLLSGAGSAAARRAALHALMARATEGEQRLLAGLITGELRHGALEGVVIDAVARATGLDLALVRHAAMLRGALPPVAIAAFAGGAAALAAFGLEVGRPLQPMLASSADNVSDALERTGPAAVEWKLDGIRVQVHRRGDDIRIFSRSLDDITARLPEIVDVVAALPATSLVADGEAIALRPDGRPHPFQQTGSRTSTSTGVAAARVSTPLSLLLFDLLHLDGEDLLALPGSERAARLATLAPPHLRIPRSEVADAAGAERILAEALGHGHEGVLVKALGAPYEAGRRGAAWVKVKPRHTLDLLVLAAEWGHGRRKGWLSNLHLGALNPRTGDHVMLGKTFKGLTDAMLTWQTERLLELADEPGGWVVPVRPGLIVEIAFDGVQSSPRYPAGMALRFARVLRHREDKGPLDVDTIDTVRPIHAVTTGRIFHVALAADWAAARKAGSYRISTRGRTLEQEGFIHCSRAEQVAGIADHYEDAQEPLLLLHIQPELLTSPVVVEAPPGSEETFPHIYGPLNLEAVVHVEAFG